MALINAAILCVIYSIIFMLNNFTYAAAFEGKIVNGTKAKDGEFPFVVSLRRSRSGRHSCGATLLNRAWALTAAHCVSRSKANQLNIQYGSTMLNPNSTKVTNVTQIYVHEGYTPSNKFVNDIALLKLQTAVKFSEKVFSVRLPANGQATAGGTPAVLIGWGLNATGGNIQKHLHKVKLQTFTDEECSERHQSQLHATTICAGVPNGGKGQCSGDSGGPLLLNDTQIGIVSWSRKPCAIPPYPGVFTEVSAYVDWIVKTIGDNAEEQSDDNEETLEQLTTGNLVIVRKKSPLSNERHLVQLNKVSLRRASNNDHFCAGTIISSLWILTAAHCFTFIKQPQDIKIQYGSNALEYHQNESQYIGVKEILRHEGYNPTISIHDIALLRLESALEFSATVKAVQLPKMPSKLNESASVVLAGWGLNTTFGNLQNSLQKVFLSVVSLNECKQQLNALLHKTNLCAGVPLQNKGQCNGDSGGPLLYSNSQLQIGIVSWSLKPCATTPGVFTNLFLYADWIKEKIY